MGSKSYMKLIIVAAVVIIAAASMSRKRGTEGFQWVSGAGECQWNALQGYNDPSCYGQDPVNDREEEARRRGVQWSTNIPLVCLGFDTPWVIWTGPMKNGLPMVCFDKTTQGNSTVLVPNVPFISKQGNGVPVDRAIGWQPTADQPLNSIYFVDPKTASTTTAPSGGTSAPSTTSAAAPTGSGFAAKDFMNQPNHNNLIVTFVGFLIVFLSVSAKIAANIMNTGVVSRNDFAIFIIIALFGFLGAFLP